MSNADIAARYPAGRVVGGVVQNAMVFGLFVQSDPRPQVPEALVHKSAIGTGAIADPSNLFAKGLTVRVRIESVKKLDGKLKISASMPSFSLTSVARSETRLPLSAGWKRYLRAAADELDMLASDTECEIELADRELTVRGRDGQPPRDALRELDDIFSRPLALLQIPPGAMGWLIGKEKRGLRELEDRFGVRTSPESTNGVMGGRRAGGHRGRDRLPETAASTRDDHVQLVAAGRDAAEARLAHVRKRARRFGKYIGQQLNTY